MNPIRKASPADLALLLFVAIIWAMAFIAIKIAVPEVGPLWLAAIRVGIGALVLAPYAIYRGMALPSSSRMWTLIIAMAILNVVIPFFLISWAELTIDAGVTSLLMGVGPFLALVSGHFFTNDDKINMRKAIGVLFGFVGVLTVVGADALSQMGDSNILGQLAALGGSLCYVTAGVLIRKIDMPPTRLAFLALLIGTVVLFPVAFLFADPISAMPSSNAMMALIFLGVLPTGVAYIIRFYLINKVGYSTFSMSINLIPVFGIFLGFLILGEPLRPQILIALALVLIGLFIAKSGGPKGEKIDKEAVS
ncbi:DMT family transporter [Ahrensia kielensis]|uniref:DMT family transporter n=1 Tax=Ahrensia kielensis TaxID=76980 RepID=A0ABU9T3H0_9HYPH